MPIVAHAISRLSIASWHGSALPPCATSQTNTRDQSATSVIIGMKRLAQLTDNPGATDIFLTAEERAQRDAISAMPPHYPGWMIDHQDAERCPRPFAFTVEK